MQVAKAQNTIHVPADQPTIQAAITAAQTGDTVLVAPGTYFENLDFHGMAITVTSSDGPAVTIVDGSSKGPVATFQTNEGASSVLNGLTLRNGVPTQAFPFTGTTGGGVLIFLSSPTITNNVITGNHAICGIGMEIRGGSAVVRGNTITGNAQAGGSGGCGGGGIEITGDFSHPPAAPQIIGNTITNNSLLAGGFGGGIEVSFSASPIIRNNFIAGNTVFNSGGGIDLESSASPVVVQNIIVNNSTRGGGSGAGIAILAASSAADVVANNTIAGNTAFDGSSGIFVNVIAPIVISNNIVVAAAGQTAMVCNSFRTTFPIFSHNDVVSPGSGGQPWSSNCAGNALNNGNIPGDPQFVDAVNGDYHLQTGSPAIDAGDNSASNLPTQDFDGHPRIAFGSAATCSNTVDMGAYEFVLTTTSSATLSPGVLDFGTIAVGSASNPQAVTFTATQGCVAKPTVAASGDFHETDNCASVLATGASCSIQVTFSPIAAGARTGTLTATSGSINLSSNLSGQAGSAVASLAPTNLVFANQPVGTTSAAQILTLTSSGTLPLQIGGINIAGDFAQANNCPASLAPGASCSISVRFIPATTGVRSGTLVVSSNGGAVSSSLNGVGIDYKMTASPSTITSKSGHQGQSVITVSALGGSLGPVALSCSGLPTGGSCSFSPSSVAPGTTSASSTLTVSTQLSGGIKTPRGTYNFTVTGTGNGLVRSTVITLVVVQ
jgi:parallel beta-helix repeat protein